MKGGGLILVFVFGVLSTLLAQEDCQLRVDKDGIKVYACDSDTTKIKSIRVEFMLNASYERLMKTLHDVEAYDQWQYNIMETRILDIDSGKTVSYYCMVDIPWPASNRDLVLSMMFSKEREGLYYVNSTTVNHLVHENEEAVRIIYFQAQWQIKEETPDRLAITYNLLVDPSGTVPIWLVNMVCANAPYHTFKNLKVMLEGQ